MSQLGPELAAPRRPIEGMLEASVLIGCCHGPRYGYELSRRLADEGLVAGPVSSGRLYETRAELVAHGALVVTASPATVAPPNVTTKSPTWAEPALRAR